MIITELANYLGRIEDLHDQISGLISGLPIQALNWRPIKGKNAHITNSLAILTRHVAGAEHFWIAETVGGQPATRDREAEFLTKATNTDDILTVLGKTTQETRDVLSTLSELDINCTRQVEGHTIPVRWCILHVIDHTALHLGHMQITYQLWSGGKSIGSPLWFERLPKT